jgi:hypothetical protein
MTKFNLNKNCLYSLLLVFMASVMLPACSSSDEAAQEDTSGGVDCSMYPAPDAQEECRAAQDALNN